MASKISSRISLYEWRETTWDIDELLELVRSDFDKSQLYSKLVFQRRLRAQLVNVGHIEPFEAALKRENPIQGGISYRIDHYDRPNASARIIKTYVGITQKDAVRRLSLHITQAKRPRGPNSSDLSLQAAIRREIESGVDPKSVFRISFLERAETNDGLIALEKKWVCALTTMAPSGYNIHPPGNLGGPSNSKPIEFEDGGMNHVMQNFMEAWHYFRIQYGEDRIPEPGTARWRYQQFLDNQKGNEGASEAESKDGRKLSIQWVFGADDTVADGRQGDTPCMIDGHFYSSVGAAAKATNKKYAALHSLYHRRLKEALEAGKPRSEPIEIGSTRKPEFHGDRLQLPDPRDPDGGVLVSASEFHKLTGTSKTSIINRWKALNSNLERYARLTKLQIVDILRHGEKNEREELTVLLPDLKKVNGVRAALAKAFAVGGSHSKYCVKALSYSGIKRRLSTISPPYTNSDLLWALGVLMLQKPMPGPALTRRKKK